MMAVLEAVILNRFFMALILKIEASSSPLVILSVLLFKIVFRLIFVLLSDLWVGAILHFLSNILGVRVFWIHFSFFQDYWACFRLSLDCFLG